MDLPFQQLTVEKAGSALEERSNARSYSESGARSRARLDNDTSSKQAITASMLRSRPRSACIKVPRQQCGGCGSKKAHSLCLSINSQHYHSYFISYNLSIVVVHNIITIGTQPDEHTQYYYYYKSITRDDAHTSDQPVQSLFQLLH